MSLKNLALLVFTSALILSGCGGGSKPPENPPPPPVVKKLAFTQEPGELAAGGTFSPVVRVAVTDASGNPVADSIPVTLALGFNAPGATLSGTLTVTTSQGVASFPELSLDKVGTDYTLVASAPGLELITSRPFNVRSGPAKALAFFSAPDPAVNHERFNSSVQVWIVDARGNRVPDATGDITLDISGGATLVGTTTVGATQGQASFTNLTVLEVGTYTLTASSASLESATSAPFEVTAGPAAELVVRVQPVEATAGVNFAPALEVVAHDSHGNPVTTFTGPVTVGLATHAVQDTLRGTLTANAVAGVARFGDLSLTKTAEGRVLSFSSPTVGGVFSQPFDVTPGPASALAFTTQPSSTRAGSSISPTVAVAVHDAFGNVVTSSTAALQLALGNNPGGGTLSGTLTVNASGGVASFPGISVDRAGSDYTLTVSSPGLPGATSAVFDVTPGTASRLAFTTQPSNVVAGAAISPTVAVAVQDAFGNTVTNNTALLHLALGTNTGGGTLSGTLTVNASGGQATFPGISVNRAGSYTLTISSLGLTRATSVAFDVTPGAASRLVFTTQPSNVVAGTAISPAVAVAVQDAFGNLVTSSTSALQLAVGNNAGGGTLSGTLTVNASGGVASFPGISLDRTGVGYTLTVSSGDLTATSTAFNVTPGTASRIAFSDPPSNVAAGIAISPAVTVRVTDSLGNTVPTSSVAITVAIGNNPGVGILNGTRTVTTLNGVATFSTLSITKTGAGYTLTAAATGYTTTTSATFDVTPGAASSLAFHRNPPNVVTAGVAISPDVQVSVRDSFNNVVTGSNATITLSLSANPGGSTLGGTLTVAALNGVASFPGLTLNRAANNYRFAAASTGLTGNTSALFNVTAGTASQLAFTTQPANVASGATLATVRVTVQDAFGNTVTTPAVTVGMAIGDNPGGAVLGGTTSVTTASGVATFSALTLDRIGTGYTLVASSAPLTSATSGAFNVTAGAASRLAFTIQPGDTSAGVAFTPSIEVTVQDAGGNRVTSSTASITLGVGTNPGGGTLSGTTTLSATGGVATFPGVSLARAGMGYTLTASATGLTGATSAAFTVAPGAATRLVFTVQPSRAFAGQAISPAVRVAAQDAFGNVSTGATDTVTVALGNNPSGATLGGTLSLTVTNGVASFADLSVSAPGNGYTLTASAGDLTGATSTAFDVVIAGSRLVYSDPAPGGQIALVRNPASTDTSVVLDLVAREELTGYSVGMNLPLDASLVQAGANVMVPGTALPAGTAPTAAYGRLPSSGPLAGVLSSGQSQKAAGPGAVVNDSAIPTGAVLYTVQLELRPGATSGLVFDGAALGPKFRALLRDRLGTDVVDGSGFAIGRLEVQ
ncbi:beta strand repeat-containing protein [Pyxidicoccus sp. 3LG]